MSNMRDLTTRLKAVIYYRHFDPSIRRTANAYGVSKSSVARWVKADSIDRLLVRDRSKRIRKRPVGNKVTNLIRNSLNADHFLGARDLQALLADNDVHASLSTIARYRKALGFRYKLATRSQHHQRAHLDHPLFQNRHVYERCIAVDEASFVAVDTPRRGWAQGQTPVPKPKPTYRKRKSLLLAIDRSGVIDYAIKDGSFNGQTYSRFLSRLPRGSTVLADNASIHKTKLVKRVALENGLSMVHMPPYCPWFNPVENAFSVVKNYFRKARVRRACENHEDDIVESLKHVTREKCTSFFDHAERCLHHEAHQV